MVLDTEQKSCPFKVIRYVVAIRRNRHYSLNVNMAQSQRSLSQLREKYSVSRLKIG